MNNKSKSWSIQTRYFALTLLLAGLVWFIIYAQELIGPLAISALLAYVLNPAVTFVNTRTKLPRPIVVGLVFLVSLAILVGLGFIFIPALPDQLVNASDEVARIIVEVEEGLLAITPISILGYEIPIPQLETMLPLPSTDLIRADVILGVVQTATTNLVWVVVILITTYYLLLDWSRLRTWFFNLAPTDYREDLRRLYEEIKLVWERYVRGQLILMVIIGFLIGIGSAALGLRGALLFGLFAALLDAILTVGPTLVMIVAMIVALFTGSTYLPISNFWFMIAVMALHTAIQGVENVWLRPRIMGQSMRIHPAVVFVGIIAALYLAGVLAALIIIPVIGSVAAIGRYVYAKILDVDPWPEELGAVADAPDAVDELNSEAERVIGNR